MTKVQFRLPETWDVEDERDDFAGDWYRQLRKQYGVEWLTFVLQSLLVEGVSRGDLLLRAQYCAPRSADLRRSDNLKPSDIGISNGVAFESDKQMVPEVFHVVLTTNAKKVKERCRGKIVPKGRSYKCDTCGWSDHFPASWHYPEDKMK